MSDLFVKNLQERARRFHRQNRIITIILWAIWFLLIFATVHEIRGGL